MTVVNYDLTTVPEVVMRIEEDVTEEMQRVILAKITDASDRARHIGLSTWTASSVPRSVSNVVAQAVARFMSNPSGYSQSRSSDETLGWSDIMATGEISFTDVESSIISSAAIGRKRPTFGTIQTVAWGNERYRPYEPIYAPSSGHGMPLRIG